MVEFPGKGRSNSGSEKTITSDFFPKLPSGEFPSLMGEFGVYEKLELVGRGGMGVVYRAWHKHLKRVEAVKLIRTGSFADSLEIARFQLEAKAGATLDHPNIVAVYGAGEILGQPYLSMKWIDGGTLSGDLSKYRNDGRESARLLTKIARAVHFAHKHGILHRDLKPGNILIDPKGEPLVADFGLAKHLDIEAGLTETGTISGTAEYMAPEQARGDKQMTVGVDVYSLGVILYAMITGAPPFTRGSRMQILQQVMLHPPVAPRALNSGVEADLEAICLKCLEKSPFDRYQSAQDLASDLDRYLKGQVLSARPPGLGDWLREAMLTRPFAGPEQPWLPIVWMGGIRLATHLAIFGFALAHWSVLWVWGTLTLHWVGWSWVIWHYLGRQFRRLPSSGRHSMMISIGHIFATFVVALAYVPFSTRVSVEPALAMYPALTALHGIVFFVQGSTHWSRFYFIGLGVLGLVPFMAIWPVLAPLLHGFCYAATMAYWAYSLGVTFGPRAAGQNSHLPEKWSG